MASSPLDRLRSLPGLADRYLRTRSRARGWSLLNAATELSPERVAVARLLGSIA